MNDYEKWNEAASRLSSKIKISPAILTKLTPACEVRNEAFLLSRIHKHAKNFWWTKKGGSYHNDKSILLKVIAPESSQMSLASTVKYEGLVVNLSEML